MPTLKLARRVALTLLALAIAGGCAGNGCGCLAPSPGVAPEERADDAVQIRLSQGAIAALEANPAALIAGFLGSSGGTPTFPIPSICEGDPQVCCTGGTPTTPCGPIEIDLAAQPGDAARLAIDPAAGQSRVAVTARARLRTASDLPIVYQGVDCTVGLDSTAGSVADVRVDLTVRLDQDATAGTTEIVVETADFTQLEEDDVSIGGGFTCFLADAFLKATIVDQLTATVEQTLQDQLTGGLCKTCPSGSVDECGYLATACTDGVCQNADGCVQELGAAGRLLAASLLGGFSPGTQGAFDLYEVAGGYATTNQGGIALGIVGGAEPAASPHDTCGPAATPPAPVDIPVSTYFQGNTRPDTGTPFDVAIGIHQSHLDQLAWAAYQGGLICITASTSAVPLLSSDTLSLLMPSLADLIHGQTAPMAIGLRPQHPPTIALGAGVIDPDSGALIEPLLDVRFDELDLDIYAMVDDQYIRVLTATLDVHLPLGLEVDGDGQIVPVLGEPDDLTSDVRVSNSEALTETPDELAMSLPTLLDLALPQLGGSLGGFALPALGPLALSVQPGGITAVDDLGFLAIFADLALATARVVPVETTAELVAVRGTAVEVALGGRAADGGALEWSLRVDDGLWSPYRRARRTVIDRPVLALPAAHTLEVRARRVGEAATTDPSPVALRLVTGQPRALARVASDELGFHGDGGASGCSCGASAAGAGELLIALAVGLLLVGRRQRRAGPRAPWLALGALVLALGGPGCSCGSDAPTCAGPDGVCLDGEVEHGAIGRWASIATSEGRTVVAAHEETLGDLVVLEVAADGAFTATVADGVPDLLPTYQPDGYRGGVAEDGPDVGAYTSIALVAGRAAIAHMDRDAGALRFSRGHDDGSYDSVVVDDGGGARAGAYASLLVIDEAPSIAYMAVGVARDDGGFATELRLASAPSLGGDWEIQALDREPISCAGLCDDGEACPLGDGVASTQVCVPVATGCGECADDQACIEGACTALALPSTATDLPRGVGLFARLRALPDGRRVVVAYDREAGDLVLYAESAGGFTEVALDASPESDTGMFCDAVVDAAGTVHVAYQDALGDQLRYLSWDGSAASPPVTVDDGLRSPETRPHPVGAGAAIFLEDGAPSIAYQDGALADLLVARGVSGTAQRSDLLAGPELYGFYVDVAEDGDTSALVSLMYDRVSGAVGSLLVIREP